MKKKITILSIAVLILITVATIYFFSNMSGAATNYPDAEPISIHLFYGRGCPHCGGMESFLKNLGKKYPLNVTEYEIYFDKENRELFEQISETFGEPIQGVPTLFIDKKVIIGYSPSIANSIENEIERCLKEECLDPINRIYPEDTTTITGDSSPIENPETTEIKKKLTIPIVITTAAVDAINPCAFAVLIILLTTILASKIRTRALYAGLAFTMAIYISYFLMGLGLYSAIQAAGLTRLFYGIVAVLAIFIGLFNLKDYFWYGRYFTMEVPKTWRPKMKALIKGITSVPGAFLIGFVVSLFLLPCTSGPYIIILGLLAEITTRNYAILLLLLYNLIFILPMLIITFGISFGITTTEKAEQWRQSKLKILHLITGAIILLIGIIMIVALLLGYI